MRYVDITGLATSSMPSGAGGRYSLTLLSSFTVSRPGRASMSLRRRCFIETRAFRKSHELTELLLLRLRRLLRLLLEERRRLLSLDLLLRRLLLRDRPRRRRLPSRRASSTT